MQVIFRVAGKPLAARVYSELPPRRESELEGEKSAECRENPPEID